MTYSESEDGRPLGISECLGILARIWSGEDGVAPSPLAERLLNGESPLLAFRDHCGLTREEVATRAGIGHDQVAAIETGVDYVPADVLRRMAVALGLLPSDHEAMPRT
ncbi:helix-turn-helix transcriptional regulator [Paracoccus sp. PAR01]|uniref:helix-turn-helix domain-containing protein n=1 Tax=Paracoccus sp. PAR01 TaxID=2769282 RepID=UPI0017809C5A|nr:helix-turn-helix transcriptional regulator [Paracoccus sp. PAR01]MBD9527828.1 helix-turn-helix domain-containing protein [Paracoccus sp. PAR01]